MEKELVSARYVLSSYHNLGKDFKVLVEEYAHLSAEVENAQWGLQRIEKPADKSQEGEAQAEAGAYSMEALGAGRPQHVED